jgi:hypothetical protein
LSCRTSLWTRLSIGRSAFSNTCQLTIWKNEKREKNNCSAHLSLGEVDVGRWIFRRGYQPFIWVNCTPLVVFRLIVAARSIFLLYSLFRLCTSLISVRQ